MMACGLPYPRIEQGPLSPRCRIMSTERQHRRDIVSFGRALHERGYVAAMDGNLSVRLGENRILATPTAMCKGVMRPSDLVIVDMQGRRLGGKRDVSSEIAMHLLIYRLRPDIRGIVHAHPPTATGFAAAGLALNQPLVCEVVIGLGSIPLAKYGTPGTPELTDALEPLVPQYDAILMANHGAWCPGTGNPLTFFWQRGGTLPFQLSANFPRRTHAYDRAQLAARTDSDQSPSHQSWGAR